MQQYMQETCDPVKVNKVNHFHNHVTPNIWSLSSSDLNPMDYYVQGAIERDINNIKDSYM